MASLYLDMQQNVRTRQTRYTDSAPRSDFESRVLVEARFGDVKGRGTELDQDVTKTLSRWARRLGGAPSTAIEAAGFISGRAEAAVRRQDALSLLTDVLGLERRLKRFVDRPADHWYAGVCGWIPDEERPDEYCARELWAEPRDAFVRCPECGTTWPVVRRRELLLEEARDRVATATMIGRIVASVLERDEPRDVPALVRSWASRGKLMPVGTRVIDGHERDVYRVGDVLDLYAAAPRRNRRRRAALDDPSAAVG